MKEVSTVAEHKINTQKSVIFLHTSNEHMEMKLKINYNSIKKDKELKNTFNKKTQDFIENYKTLK